MPKLLRTLHTYAVLIAFGYGLGLGWFKAKIECGEELRQYRPEPKGWPYHEE